MAAIRPVLESVFMSGAFKTDRAMETGRARSVPRAAPYYACAPASGWHQITRLLVDDIGTTVFRPCCFVVAFGFRLFFAQRHGFDLRLRHAQRGHGFTHGFGTFLTQGQVVLGAAAFIGVTLDQDRTGFVLLQVVGVVLHDRFAVVAYDVAVEVEVHAALGQHALWIVQRIDHWSDDRSDRARVVNDWWWGDWLFDDRDWLGDFDWGAASRQDGGGGDGEG